MKEGDLVRVFSLQLKIGTIVGFNSDEIIVMFKDGNFWKGSKRDVSLIDESDESDEC